MIRRVLGWITFVASLVLAVAYFAQDPAIGMTAAAVFWAAGTVLAVAEVAVLERRRRRQWRLGGPLVVSFIDCMLWDEELGRVPYTALRVGPVLVSWRPCVGCTWVGWRRVRPAEANAEGE